MSETWAQYLMRVSADPGSMFSAFKRLDEPSQRAAICTLLALILQELEKGNDDGETWRQ